MAPNSKKKKKRSTIDASHLLIKGYLPVRIRYPPAPTADDDEEHETFLFLKEHRAPEQAEDVAPTLFVANAPSYPVLGIDTATLLRALLGRWGRIQRVTVVPRPRGGPTAAAPSSTPDDWYFDNVPTDRFAHVVFASRHDLQQCYQALVRCMPDGLTVDAVERQTLADAAAAEKAETEEGIIHDDQNNEDDEVSGLQRVLQNYRQQQARHADREALLEQCNAVMEAYDEAEAAKRAAANAEPDEDGFITVTRDTALVEASLSTSAAASTSTRRARNRKRKKGPGAAELDDFYRFQTKARRRQDVQTLRQRFQEDLQRLERLKERRGGKMLPFG